MEQDPWLVKEAERVAEDVRALSLDISLIERKFQVQQSDSEKTIVLGASEWTTFKSRIADCCEQMLENIEDFVANEYQRQLHWSALRLLTASGMLSAEIAVYREKLAYIAGHPSEHADDAQNMLNWIAARIEPLCRRLSVRLTQIMARVLDPTSWEISTELAAVKAADGSGGNVRLTLRFEPNTEERARAERERIKRLQRLDVGAG